LSKSLLINRIYHGGYNRRGSIPLIFKIAPMSIKSTILLCIGLGTSLVLSAQQPLPARQARRPLASVDQFQLPQQNNAALLREELAARSKDRAPRFATTVEVDLSPQRTGTWEYLRGGLWMWRQRIHSRDAQSLNLGLGAFHLPPGAELRIYDPTETLLQGPFRAADNDEHTRFWTPVVAADEIVVELIVPEATRDEVQLKIDQVNHDFVGITKILSGSCNLDVVCDEEDGFPLLDRYRDNMQSVAMYTLEGRTFCTGFLVNNTKNDCRPYFMTADHCNVDEGNAPSMVVYWNYQNSYCRPPNSENSGRPGNGSRRDFNSGATFRAAYGRSDFALVELDDPVSNTANAYFAGWNATDQLQTGTNVVIHHPSTSEKRISIEYDDVYRGNWGQGASAIDDGDHVIVANWEVGTTEDGSSGGPLFNQFGEVIGQLHGGAASCDQQSFDAFGWFHASWQGGGQPENSLEPWLNPINSNELRLGGRWNASCFKSLRISDDFAYLCPGKSTTVGLTLSEAFQDDVQLFATDIPEGIQLRFIDNPLQAGASTSITIKADSQIVSSEYVLTISATDGMDTIQTEMLLGTTDKPGAFNLVEPLGGSVDLDTDGRLRWQNSPNALYYEVSIATDPDFQQVVAEEQTPDNFFFYQGLEYSQTYFWKVEAVSPCGRQSLEEDAFFTTIPDLRIELINQPTEICPGDSLSYMLRLGAGYEGPVTLTATTDPLEGIDVRFEDDSKTYESGALVRVWVKADSNYLPGIYHIDFRAEDDQRSNVERANLLLREAPQRTVLRQPAPRAKIVEPRPLFIWDLGAGVSDYQLQVARDPDFEDVLLHRQLDASSYQMNQDLAGGIYYWRVTVANSCGTAVSAVRRFTVQDNDLGELNGSLLSFEPNPTNGPIRIFLSLPLDGARLDIMDITGRVLHSQVLPAETLQWEADLSSYAEGTYLIRIQHRQMSLTRRIVHARY